MGDEGTQAPTEFNQEAENITTAQISGTQNSKWTLRKVVEKIINVQNYCRNFTERDEWKTFSKVSK